MTIENKDIVLFEANGAVESVSPTIRQCAITSLALKALKTKLDSE